MDDLLLSLHGLIGGGPCFSHTHHQVISLDDLHRMQQLETVVFASQNYSCREQDDFIFVDSTLGPVTVTLAPSNFGQHVTVSRYKGTSLVTIAAPAGETINLAASVTLNTSFTPRRFKGLSRNPRPIPVINGYLEI